MIERNGAETEETETREGTEQAITPTPDEPAMDSPTAEGPAAERWVEEEAPAQEGEEPEVDESEEVLLNGETAPLPPLGEKEVLVGEHTVPLPPIVDEPLLAPTNVPEGIEPYLLCARRSHAGRIRRRNQDSCITFVSQTGGHETLPPFGLFIVADGMGGHMDGDVAGRIVSRAVAEYLLRHIYVPLLEGNPLASQRPIPEVMKEAAAQANAALRLPDPAKEMGTTLTAGLILGRRLYMIHVGDSRAYLWSGEELKQITTDHSVVKALEEAGQLTPEEAANHPNRNLLYRALMGEELEVDSFSVLLPRSGTLVLCSDGLWGLISEPQLVEVLQEQSRLQEKADELVEQAIEAGGHDNITIIIVDFAL